MNDLVGLNLEAADEWDEFVSLVQFCVIDETPLEVTFNERGLDRSKSVVCVDCGIARYGLKRGCRECGSRMVGFRVRDSDREILDDPTKSMERVWFHATDNPDWLEDVIEAGVTVHLGSFATALNAAAMRSERDESYVWKIQINESATVVPWVAPDSVDKWIEDVEEFTANTGFDFLNYVNLYESPGSISMIGDPNMITILGMEVIDPLQAAKVYSGE